MTSIVMVAFVVYAVVAVVLFCIGLGGYATAWDAAERRDAARFACQAPLWPLNLAALVRDMVADGTGDDRDVTRMLQLAPTPAALPSALCDRPGCTRTDLAPLWLSNEPFDFSAGHLCPDHMPEGLAA